MSIKQVTKVYQVKYTIALFWNFGISTALMSQRHFFQNTCFKENYTMAAEKISE